MNDNDRWVNAVITIVVPMVNIDTTASRDAKMEEVLKLHEDLVTSLSDSFNEAVSSCHWEDVTGDE